MALWQRISRQLSHPTGLGGRLVARLMNRGNQRMNLRAIELLDLAPGMRVLDLGFGGGLALGALLGREAQVTGIDRAADMVTAARRKHRDALAAGRLQLAEGDVHALPFPDASFERVLTVNTVYFWPDLPAALTEIRRVLAPDGRLVIGIRDPLSMRKVSRDIFTVRPAQDVSAAAEHAGFSDVRLDSPTGEKVHFIVGRRGPDQVPAR